MSLLLLFNQPPYHQTLLRLAKTLHDEGRPQLAVVTAQMACEIVGEQVLSALLSARVGGLETAVSDLVPSHHLAHDRVRALFDELTNGDLAQQPWWPEYKAHVKRRNEVIHRGRSVNERASAASLSAAESFCNHVLSLAPRS